MSGLIVAERNKIFKYAETYSTGLWLLGNTVHKFSPINISKVKSKEMQFWLKYQSSAGIF